MALTLEQILQYKVMFDSCMLRQQEKLYQNFTKLI